MNDESAAKCGCALGLILFLIVPPVSFGVGLLVSGWVTAIACGVIAVGVVPMLGYFVGYRIGRR
jgi:hypothetical protein